MSGRSHNDTAVEAGMAGHAWNEEEIVGLID